MDVAVEGAAGNTFPVRRKCDLPYEIAEGIHAPFSKFAVSVAADRTTTIERPWLEIPDEIYICMAVEQSWVYGFARARIPGINIAIPGARDDEPPIEGECNVLQRSTPY